MMTAYDKALSLLAIREHTAREIQAKLLGKGYSEEDAKEAVSRLLAENAISEDRFAESFIRSRMRRNPEGKPVLMMRLKERGCPPSVSERALDEFWESEAYLPFLISLIRSLSGKKDKDHLYMTLARKGFTRAEIRRAEEVFADEDQ